MKMCLFSGFHYFWFLAFIFHKGYKGSYRWIERPGSEARVIVMTGDLLLLWLPQGEGWSTHSSSFGGGSKRSNQMLLEYKSEENTPGIISQLQTTHKETIRNQDVQDAHRNVPDSLPLHVCPVCPSCWPGTSRIWWLYLHSGICSCLWIQRANL